MNEPKCPYCGAEMQIHVSMLYENCAAVGYTSCPDCHCNGPTVCVFEQDAKGVDSERMHASAREAAMRRPLQKPLTLCELRALIDTDDDVVTYCESYIDAHAYANIWYRGKCIDRGGVPLDIRQIGFDFYNKTWRAWAHRPTDEEREATLWGE